MSSDKVFRSVDHALCPFCSCLCDDLRLTLEAGRVVHAERACALGKAGFARASDPDQPAARINGRAVQLPEALDESARLLLQARFPLVFGLADATCEAQREAVALAELLGASLDPGPPAGASLALASVGGSAATLGEVKHRADLVLYWAADPARSHPRHLTRYTAMPRGRQVPNGRRDRTVIVVDARPSASARAADEFIQIKPNGHFEALWAVRLLVRGLPLGPAVEEACGLSPEALGRLAARLQRCRFGALFYGDALARSRGGQANVEAALALATELNEQTRFVALPLAARANLPGAENVLAWQTGYLAAINFGRGYPRSSPGEFSAGELLARGEADAVLTLASDPGAGLPEAAAKRLRQIPTVILNSQPGMAAPWARVAFSTDSLELSSSGTVYRMDDVPLSLRPALSSPYPSAEEVLNALRRRVEQLAGERLQAWPGQLAALAAAWPGEV